jgi:hypothetical protein
MPEPQQLPREQLICHRGDSLSSLSASTKLDVDDPWYKRCVPVFGTEDPPAPDSRTETLESVAELWAGTDFDLNSRSLQKWREQGAESRAASPLRLFVTDDFESVCSFDGVKEFLEYASSRDDGEKLAERLVELKTDLADDENASDLSIASVSGLIRFLQDNPRLRDPGLVASNNGNIRAEWHKSWAEHFVIEFTSKTDARFVLFVSDTSQPDKKVRISITCPIASVMRYASPHGIDSWVLRH